MKIFGIDAQNSPITNADFEMVTMLPTNPSEGRFVFLTSPYSTYSTGLYTFDNGQWILSGGSQVVDGGTY